MSLFSTFHRLKKYIIIGDSYIRSGWYLSIYPSYLVTFFFYITVRCIPQDGKRERTVKTLHLHFLSNVRDVACLVTDINPALPLITRAGKSTEFIPPIGNRAHNHPVYTHTLFYCATTAFSNITNIMKIMKKFSIKKQIHL